MKLLPWYPCKMYQVGSRKQRLWWQLHISDLSCQNLILHKASGACFWFSLVCFDFGFVYVFYTCYLDQKMQRYKFWKFLFNSVKNKGLSHIVICKLYFKYSVDVLCRVEYSSRPSSDATWKFIFSGLNRATGISI